MKTPTVEDLPHPPARKVGWPWTVGTDPLPPVMDDDSLWPKISIVTPSYNQGEFLEEAMRSVLLQGYPRLEYIIVDGGSEDNSVDIIKKYDKWISYWVSEPDGGQSYAINHGFRLASGDIIAWLNSDDMYKLGVLAHVAKKYLRSYSKDFWIVMGIEYWDFEKNTKVVDYQKEKYDLKSWITGEVNPNQQGTFWSRDLLQRVGFLKEDLHYGMDKEIFMRLLSKGYKFSTEKVVAAIYRQHGACKWKKGLAPFKYEWSKIGLSYLPFILPDYRRVISKQLKGELSHVALRLAQDHDKNVFKRLSYWYESASVTPRMLLSRTFWGTLVRLAVSGLRRSSLSMH